MDMRLLWSLVVFSVVQCQPGCKVDVLFVIDSTGSVTKDYKNQIDFAHRVADGLTLSADGIHGGIILFASEERRHVVVPIGSVDNKEAFVSRIDKLPHYSGTTFAGKALDLAKTELQKSRRPDANALVIVITDGFSRDPAGPQADMLRSERNTKVVAVGVASKIWLEELIRIGGDEKNVFQGMESSSEILKVVSGMCGGTDVPNVGGPGSGATTPSSGTTTVATPTEPAVAGCVLDVLFILDASGSVQRIFEEEIRISNTIIDELTVGPNNARIAFIRFAGPNKERTVIGFDDHKNKTSLLDAVNKITFIGGTTDVAGALRLANKELTAKGRSTAMPYIIVFTDGYSSTDVKKDAEELRKFGNNVYVIAIKSIAFSQQILEQIAGDPTHVYTDDNLDEFYKEKERVTASCKH